MLLPEADRDVFKRWLLPKLETISDADAEVLADYVIALITAEESETDVRRNCLESLSDFLQNHTNAFVDEVLKVLKQRSYSPGTETRSNATTAPPAPVQPTSYSHTAPIPSIVGTSASDYISSSLLSGDAVPFNPPRGPAADRAPGSNAPKSHRLPDRPTGLPTSQSHQSRKRKLNDGEFSQVQENGELQISRAMGGERPFKQVTRRNGRHAKGITGQDAQQGQVGFEANPGSMPLAPNLAGLPPPPPGVPPFDPNNPMALFAMAAAFGMMFPGVPPHPFAGALGQNSNTQTRRERCRDYDSKGFCVNGSMCPYEHGGEIVVPPDQVPEYDPRRSSLGINKEKLSHTQKENKRRQAPSVTNNHRSSGRHGRATLFRSGDPSNTTLVVEHIPEENFNEGEVRRYFSNFGNIVGVRMQEHRRSALVEFEDHGAANEAYNSPQVIFDNRFVSVHWYQSESASHDVNEDEADPDEYLDMHDRMEEVLDLEAIGKRQAEAQKAFEERRKKEEEAAARAEEIDRQLKATNEEVRKLRRELADKTGEDITNNRLKDEDDLNGIWEDGFLSDSQDLSTLQAEAQNLFAAQDADAPAGRGRGYSRRGFRGRPYGSYHTRGRGYASPFRGGYRGRGYPGAPLNSGRSSVKRLDNRPKRISIAGVEAGSKTDETIRQHLLNIPDCISVEQHLDQPDTLVVSFKERYMAEIFLGEAARIPEVSKLELAWVPNDVSVPAHSLEPKSDLHASDDDSSATVTDQDKDISHTSVEVDADMDVADDVDEWL